MENELKTPGELATSCFEAFKGIMAIVDTPDGYDLAMVTGPSLLLVSDTLALADKLPKYARQAFADTLPFRPTELTGITNEASDNETRRVNVAERITEWLIFKSVQVESRNKRCVDYLAALIPFMDLWSERWEATKLKCEIDF